MLLLIKWGSGDSPPNFTTYFLNFGEFLLNHHTVRVNNTKFRVPLLITSEILSLFKFPKILGGNTDWEDWQLPHAFLVATAVT